MGCGKEEPSLECAGTAYGAKLGDTPPAPTRYYLLKWVYTGDGLGRGVTFTSQPFPLHTQNPQQQPPFWKKVKGLGESLGPPVGTGSVGHSLVTVGS